MFLECKYTFAYHLVKTLKKAATHRTESMKKRVWEDFFVESLAERGESGVIVRIQGLKSRRE